MMHAHTTPTSTRNLAQLVKCGALSLALIAGSSVFADVTDQINKSYDFSNGGRISLSNVNGDVSISACDCNRVEISAEIIASSQEARDQIEVIIDADADHIDIETRHKSRNGWNNNTAKVEYTLTVPNGVLLRGMKLVNGNLTISGVSGELDANLVNGDLTSDGLTSDTQVQTVNGEVDIKFESLANAKRIELESVNGRIAVALPGDADADIKASTVNGRIRNQFGIDVDKGKYVGSKMRGTLGNGGVRLQLSNVNGAIEVNSH